MSSALDTRNPAVSSALLRLLADNVPALISYYSFDGLRCEFANAAYAKTYSSATSVNAFDANGKAVSLTFYYQKAAPDQWNIYATADGASVAGRSACSVSMARGSRSIRSS